MASNIPLCPVPFSLRPLSRLQAACHQLKLWPELQDNGGDYVSAALGPLTNILVQGLGCRLHLLAHSRPPVPEVRHGWTGKFVGFQKGWIQGSKGTHSMLPSRLASRLGLGTLGLKSTCLPPTVGYQPGSPEAQGRWDLDSGIALPARGTDQRY